MIKFNCFTCSEPMEVPDSFRGSTINCPKCNTHLRVQSKNMVVNAPVQIVEMIGYIMATIFLIIGIPLFFGHIFHDTQYFTIIGGLSLFASTVILLLSRILFLAKSCLIALSGGIKT